MESVDVIPANIVAEPEPVPESTPMLSEPDSCLGKVNEVEADEMAPAPEKVVASESVSDSMEVDTSEPQSDSTLEPASVLKTIDESAHESDGMAVDIEAAARVPTPVPLPGEDDESAHEAAEEEASADCDASDAASGAPAVEASVESAVAAVEESNEMSTDQEAVKPEPVEHSTPDRPSATSQVTTERSTRAPKSSAKNKSPGGSKAKRCQCRRKKCPDCNRCEAAHCTCGTKSGVAKNKPKSKAATKSARSKQKSRASATVATIANADAPPYEGRSTKGVPPSPKYTPSPTKAFAVTSPSSRSASSTLRESQAFEFLERCVQDTVAEQLIEVARGFRQKLDTYVRRTAKSSRGVAYTKEDVDRHTMRCLEIARKAILSGKNSRSVKSPAGKARTSSGSSSAFSKPRGSKSRAASYDYDRSTPSPPPRDCRSSPPATPETSNGLAYILEAMSSSADRGKKRKVSTCEESAASALSSLATASLFDPVDSPRGRRQTKSRSRSPKPKSKNDKNQARKTSLSMSSSHDSLSDELSVIGSPSKRRSPLPPHLLKPFEDEAPLRVPTPEAMLADVLAVTSGQSECTAVAAFSVPPKSPLRAGYMASGDATTSSTGTSATVSADESSDTEDMAAIKPISDAAALMEESVSASVVEDDTHVEPQSDESVPMEESLSPTVVKNDPAPMEECTIPSTPITEASDTRHTDTPLEPTEVSAQESAVSDSIEDSAEDPSPPPEGSLVEEDTPAVEPMEPTIVPLEAVTDKVCAGEDSHLIEETQPAQGATDADEPTIGFSIPTNDKGVGPSEGSKNQDTGPSPPRCVPVPPPLKRPRLEPDTPVSMAVVEDPTASSAFQPMGMLGPEHHLPPSGVLL
eukprot:m.441155 g.441155  ORF g.441155 m.441155 type:complete len:865 (+) comp18622_c0_seq1:267-2861(+)